MMRNANVSLKIMLSSDVQLFHYHDHLETFAWTLIELSAIDGGNWNHSQKSAVPRLFLSIHKNVVCQFVLGEIMLHCDKPS